MSPIAENVIDRLEAACQKWWLFTLLTTTVWAAAASLSLLFVFVLADAVLVLPQAVLSILFAVWLTLTLALLGYIVRRIFRGQRSVEAAARRVESEFPELGSNLINIVQLAGVADGDESAFCEAAVSQSASKVGHIHFDRAALRQSRLRRFVLRMNMPRDFIESAFILAAVIAAVIVCQTIFPNWGSAANRLLSPWKFVPSIGEVGSIEVTPGDTDVLIGDGLDITAQIANPDGKPYKAVLYVTQESAADIVPSEADIDMSPGEDNRTFKTTLSSIARPISYRLEIGDSQTGLFHVGVRKKPTVEEVAITYHYPEYLGWPDKTTTGRQADLQAPQYTLAELKIRPSTPIADGYVEQSGRRLAARVEDDGNTLAVNELAMIENGTFKIRLQNDAGHSDPDPRVNRVRVLPDRPPTAQLLKPGRQITAAPGDTIDIILRGVDDHGLGAAKLQTRIKKAETEGDESAVNEPIVTQKHWNGLDGSKTVTLEHSLKLNEGQPAPGSVLLVRAVAVDRRDIDISRWGIRLRPQEAAGPWHSIRIIGREEKTADDLRKLRDLRAAVYNILEKQIRTRVAASQISKHNCPKDALRLSEDVRSKQINIQKTTFDLAGSITQTDQKDRLNIKKVLGRLSMGEMVEAVRHCDSLQNVKPPDGFTPTVASLTKTQDEIIDGLRNLLGTVRRAEAEMPNEMKKRYGGDLPDDVEKKLEQMRDRLAEFLKQQKKIIEATENLAKTPVDDFTEEEKQLLEKLAAAEDDWSRFLKDLHSDMSKLPEQDFSNPSMLKELVEIQTEIKMAEDALTKKTLDIAVPLEQLGYEMAEEIKTNMEKWLPDSPDRERWSQEESLTDDDKEAPMAELPGELEDLIGELMEEEDDLFDEMEDISSSAADSLDKGAGWDALDGPISNMSAKGVTGNRLPNTSEMGGRAGEGRSGKSSGEFVGDEAVGKGGRKTPSRLAADPYEKGQIKDHSRDPVGGATGGGKESGQGGEGLEGPQSRSPGHRNMQRLAERQAALRNWAESIDLKFKILNFHHTDLDKLIGVMAQVERDLKAGRYKNALRQRKAIARGLGGLKQYVRGEFHVRQDTTANLPADIQKEILGAADDPAPAGWEQVNRNYFRRLSGCDADKSSSFSR